MRGMRRRPIFVAALSLSLFCLNTVATPTVSAALQPPPMAESSGESPPLRMTRTTCWFASRTIRTFTLSTSCSTSTTWLPPITWKAPTSMYIDVGTNQSPATVAASPRKDPNVELAEAGLPHCADIHHQ